MKKLSFALPVCALSFACLANTSCVVLLGVPTAVDAYEATDLAEAVAKRFPLAKSKSAPWKSPIFVNPGASGGPLGRTPHTVFIYTVTDKQRQTEILEFLRHYKREKGLRPLTVRFFREENWIADIGRDGSWRGGHRGHEQCIRSEELR